MYLLFEVGGTNTRIGFSADGKTIENIQKIPTSEDFGQFLSTLREQSQQFGEIKAICGGIPVVFNRERTTPIASAHLPKWVGRSIKKDLETTFQAPALLENETALGALGEATKGAGVGSPIVAFITVGTGIGGTRIVDGKIDRRIYGFEPGHHIIIPDGQPCACGGKGHLEAYVAGFYLEQKYKQKGEFIKDPNVWEEVARYLAIGLYNVSVHWSPNIFVLGGSVISGIPLESVKKYLQGFSTIFPQVPEIRPASLGNEAALIGALEYLHQNI